MASTKSNHPHWNFQEFTTFLLLYAAHADYVFKKEEEEMIKTRVSEETYEMVNTEFEDTNDYERIQIIMTYKGLYFPTAARRGELLDLMRKQFFVDGDFSTLEKNVMMMIEKIL